MYKNKIISGLFWTFGERICAQCVSFIVSTVLARILLPEVYGIVTMVNIFITIANVFVSDGFGNSLIQKKDADELDFNSMFYSSLATSVLIYIVLYISAPFIADFFNESSLSLIIRVFSLKLPISAISTIQHAYVSRHMIFRKFFFSTLIGTILSGIIGIILAVYGWGVWALIVQYMTNSIVDCFVLFVTVPWRPKLQFSVKRSVSLMKYGFNILCTGIISVLYGQLRAFVIGKKYTTKDLAYYSYGEKIPALIGTNVDTTISSVLFPAMSDKGDNIVQVKEMTRQSMRISAYVIFPLMTGLALVAEPLILCLLTEKWLPCVFFLKVFCFEKGLSPCSTANLQAIKAIGRSDVLLKMELIKKIVGIIVILIAMQVSVKAIGYACIINAIFAAAVNIIPNGKLLKYKAKEQLKDLYPIILLNIGMAAIITILSKLIELFNISIICMLIIKITIGIIVYIFLSSIFNIYEFNYLKDTFFNLIVRKK